MTRGRYGWIRDEARTALTLSGATGPHDIDVLRIAKALDIEVIYGGVEGATERITMLGGRARIRVSDEIVLIGRRYFTIGHAIGHKACGHVIATDGDVAAWITTACSGRTKTDERESDVFSTELLTPEAWVRPYCDPVRVDLGAVDTITRTFPVSPVMAAMRFVELTRHACAIVYAERGIVKWARGSRTFARVVAREMRLPRASIAAEFFDRGVLSTSPREQIARTWLPNTTRIADHTTLIEHALHVPEPEWGGVLSLLWIPEMPVRTIDLANAEKIAPPM